MLLFNLKKHLNSIHKNTTLVAKEVEKSEHRKQRLEDDGDCNSNPKRQCNLPTVLNRHSIPANKLEVCLQRRHATNHGISGF